MMFDAGVSDLPIKPDATVLIVEDEQVSRRALACLLSSSGYQTAAYANAEDALHGLRDESGPAVALLDVDLPGMSGLDLACELEQIRPGVVIILITAASGDRIDRFRVGHAVHYLPKPLDFDRLLRLLNQANLPN